MDNTKATLKDIGGYEYQKKEALDMVDFLRNYDDYVSKGAELPNGIIFYGMPGTGKSMFANAIANDANVPLIKLLCSDIIGDTSVSVSIKNAFDKAKEKTPSILLIDEIDQMCPRQFRDPSDKEKEVLRSFLTEIDNASGSGVLVIATSNTDIHSIPPALVRNGRIEKHIEVSSPDFEDRCEILKIYLSKSDVFLDIDPREISKMTNGFTGSSLNTLINNVLIKMIKDKKDKATYQDFFEPIQIINANGSKKKDKGTDPSHIIYHEIGHFILDHYYSGTYGSINTLPFGSASGMYVRMNGGSGENESLTYEDLFNDSVICLAGLASTEVFLKKRYIGATSDIEKATYNFEKSIRNALTDFKGAGDIYGSSLTSMRYQSIGAVELTLNKDLERYLDKAYEKAKEIIKLNRGLCERLYERLKDSRCLDAIEVERIVREYESIKTIAHTKTIEANEECTIKACDMK